MGIKVEIEFISISIHCVRTTFGGILVSFYYITLRQDAACRVVASSHTLVAVTSTGVVA